MPHSAMSRRDEWLAPRPVPDGATIGLFSPSEPLANDRQRRLEASLCELTARGYQLVFASHAKESDSYMAGSPNQRVSDIMELLQGPEVDALLATWGGKSCNQLVRLLDYNVIRRQQKPIFAFSDGAVLMNAISLRARLGTFHGPNVAGKLSETQHPDLASYWASPPSNVFGESASQKWQTWRPGGGTGRLFGGNLSTMVLGLVGWIDPQELGDWVFFWESGSEPPQIVDQYLTCLANAGWLESCKAMVVGDVIYEEPNDFRRRSVRDTVLGILSRYRFPVVHCPTFGHAALENPPIPIGSLCCVDSDHRSARLTGSYGE